MNPASRWYRVFVFGQEERARQLGRLGQINEPTQQQERKKEEEKKEREKAT
jgi:hypothetical protein